MLNNFQPSWMLEVASYTESFRYYREKATAKIGLKVKHRLIPSQLHGSRNISCQILAKS